MYIADGDYIKDIEVNDLRNRYTLTKGATQKMVKLLRVLDYTSSYSSPHLTSPHLSSPWWYWLLHSCGIQRFTFLQ